MELNCNEFTLKSLQELAKEYGIPYTKKNKEQLCNDVNIARELMKKQVKKKLVPPSKLPPLPGGRKKPSPEKKPKTSSPPSTSTSAGAGTSTSTGTTAAAATTAAATTAASTADKNVFYSDTNPQGFMRKVTYREVNVDLPLLIFNLERLQLGDEVVTAPIFVDEIIEIDPDNNFHLLASVIWSDYHYYTYFRCQEPSDAIPIWYKYDDTSQHITEIGTFINLRDDTDINTNGVLHFYSHERYLPPPSRSACTLMGPMNVVNSCYMDSVLFAIFRMGNQVLEQKLLHSNIDNTDKKIGCPVEVRTKLRDELQKAFDYFSGVGAGAGADTGDGFAKPVCASWRRLYFAKCKLPGFENFGTTRQMSASEFLIYLFAIFNVDEPGLSVYTYGSHNLESDPLPYLFPEEGSEQAVEAENPFTLTSFKVEEFNYIFMVDAFKIMENSGMFLANMLGNIDDIIL
jgi:hypothetical protein